MDLSVWDPLHEMEALLDRYGRPSSKALNKNDEKTFEVGDWMPVVDIYETDDDFIVKAELPGVEKDDVHVHLENGILTIRGEKKTEIEAEYKDGVLNLTLPKPEESKPNQIEVKIK
ncbi:MAG: Hsp20/alpha crystallin family protein [Thiomicrorhabdus sp.]|nr:Hsp20/alpha crystallin family protein [Thiomicrorhabdus sp.]